MNVYPVAREEIGNGYTHVVTIDFTDLNTTAGLTKTLEMLPATLVKVGTEIFCKGFYVETAFAGCATLTLQVGDGNDTDRYLTAAVADLKTAGYKSVLQNLATTPFTYTAAADSVDALVTATTDNLTALTAGKVYVFLRVVNLAAGLP